MDTATSELIIALRRTLGDAQVLTNDEDLIPYSFDGTAALKQRPACVVFPLSTSRWPPV